MAETFFTTEDGDWFQPTEHARGPWDPDACHAGPPTALLVRAFERAVPDKRLTRITVDLIRPIPFDGFRVVAQIERDGRAVAHTRAELVDRDGVLRARAAGLLLAPSPPADLPTAELAHPAGRLDQAQEGRFPLKAGRHDLPAFNGPGVAFRYPPGETPDPGPTVAWMWSIPMLPGEEPSPFQRICPLADSGNAISRNAEPDAYAFLNADLTIVLHREPEGAWLGSRAVSHWQPDGRGLADAELFDQRGPVGRALQTLLVRPGG